MTPNRISNKWNSTWTPEVVTELRRLYEAGFTDSQIAEQLPGHHSGRAICAKRARLGLITKSMRDPVKVAAARARRDEERLRPTVLTPQEASLWHLIDLKRAGHSPIFTELRITSEGAVARIAPEPCMTYRSPAAMLAEG